MDEKTSLRSHVVILGAGASRAAFPNGDVDGRRLPAMNDLAEIVGVSGILEQSGITYSGNFEELYSTLREIGGHENLLCELNDKIYQYFSEMRLPDNVTIYDRLILSLNEGDIIASFN